MSFLCSILADMLKEHATETNNKRVFQLSHEELANMVRDALQNYWQTIDEN
mgnify:CR=1 FL=1